MKQTADPYPKAQTAMAESELRRLAGRAIEAFAAQDSNAAAEMDDRFDQLCEAFLSADEGLHHSAIDALRAGGLSNVEIIDLVVPSVARILGELWFQDKISFVHVTIGTARLQETVRALSVRHKRVPGALHERPVLLVLPKTEQHSLGCVVAAEQFRRFGYPVDIAMDRTPAQIGDLLRKRRFALVGITASGRRALASAREVIDTIRGVVTQVTPIVIGGSVLESDLDVLGLTGADHIAHDAQTALRKCGLSIVGAARPQIETAECVG